MTQVHTDTLDCALDCFSTVAIAEAYAELTARMATDSPVADGADESHELGVVLAALGYNLAQHVMRDDRR